MSKLKCGKNCELALRRCDKNGDGNLENLINLIVVFRQLVSRVDDTSEAFKVLDGDIKAIIESILKEK